MTVLVDESRIISIEAGLNRTVLGSEYHLTSLLGTECEGHSRLLRVKNDMIFAGE
jgi:hypothetical protein